MSGPNLRDTLHPSRASRTTFSKWNIQWPEGPSSRNSLGKVACKFQSLLSSISVLETSSSEPLYSAFTVVIAIHAWVLSAPLPAVRMKRAGSGKFPSGVSSPTNVYRLFMKSQARGPESGNTHLELDDIRDAHKATPLFYSSIHLRHELAFSLQTCFLMVRPRFSAGYL